jgi:hypothetical protein
VRFDRAGPVEFGHAFGLALSSGDQVVVTDARGEREGRVVIAPGQILAAPAGALSSWTAIRLANVGLRPMGGRQDPTLEMPAGGSDWLVRPGDPPEVQDDSEGSHFAREWIEGVFSGAHAADGAKGSDS